jgi:hypothetical protein
MQRHLIFAALIVALGTSITLSKGNAYAKAKQQQPIQTIWQDGNPAPLCPPPPMPCK